MKNGLNRKVCKMIDKIDVVLDTYDEALVHLYLTLFSENRIACYGQEWIINTNESTIEFKTYKSFIKHIEDEIKECLLSYVLNCEVNQLKSVLVEYV